MPTFFARRYARTVERIGRTERLVGLFVLLLLAGIVALFVAQVLTDRNYLFVVDPAAYREPAPTGPDDLSTRTARVTAEADNPFPEPGLDDWHAPPKASRFTPDSLYKKINGRASIYLQFHVVSLTFGTYDHQTDPTRTADVYLYDMGTPANALGIYQTEASPGATPVSIGDHGYQVDPAVFFCKGASYVQILPTGLDEADVEAARAIAAGVAESIEDAHGDQNR